MDFLLRFRNALFLIAVLLAQALALAVQLRTPASPDKPDTSGIRLIRLWTTGVISPFERGAHGIGSGLRHGWSNYIDLRHGFFERRVFAYQTAVAGEVPFGEDF